MPKGVVGRHHKLKEIKTKINFFFFLHRFLGSIKIYGKNRLNQSEKSFPLIYFELTMNIFFLDIHLSIKTQRKTSPGRVLEKKHNLLLWQDLHTGMNTPVFFWSTKMSNITWSKLCECSLLFISKQWKPSPLKILRWKPLKLHILCIQSQYESVHGKAAAVMLLFNYVMKE